MFFGLLRVGLRFGFCFFSYKISHERLDPPQDPQTMRTDVQLFQDWTHVKIILEHSTVDGHVPFGSQHQCILL